MKKLLFMIPVLLITLTLNTYATYCWYNRYWNYYCSYDDWTYEYWNRQNEGNPYKWLEHYRWSWPRYNYETPNEKCNRVYPWTIYRSSDGWCACEWDSKWHSSRDSTLRKCPSNNEKCNKEYPWTIWRRSDGWCACEWDPTWTSSWNPTTRSCKKYTTDSNTSSKKWNNNWKSSQWFWGVLWIIVIIVILKKIFDK